MADDAAVFGMAVDLVQYRAQLDQSVVLANTAATRIVATVAGAGRGAGAAFAGLVDQFGRPVEAVRATGDAIVEAGGKAEQAGHGFELGGRSMARMAAIGVQQVIPALDGSRVAVEGALLAVGHMSGGYAALTIAGIGVAAVLGGALVTAFVGQKSAARAAAEGVTSLDESIQKLHADIDSSVASIERWDQVSRAIGATNPGGQTRAGLPPGLQAVIDYFRGRSGDRVGAARSGIEALEGAKLLEDPNAGPAGSIVKKQAEEAAKAIFDLEKAVNQFHRSAALAAVDDPLDKMLIADYQRAQDLIDQINALTGATTRERDAMKALVGEAAGRNQIALRGQATKIGQQDLATRLGLGDTNLLSGFAGLKQTSKDLDQFTKSIEDLAREGVPAADLFAQIAEAQGKFDEKLAGLKTKFADSPALLGRVLEIERQFGSGGLQKNLDATVRGLQGLKQGAATSEDALGNLVDVSLGRAVTGFGEAGQAGDFLAGVLFDDMPKAAGAANVSMVVLTEGAYGLARALAAARLEAVLLAGVVGPGGTAGPPGPGNFQ